MRLMLDTHALAWFMLGSSKLSRRARGAIEDIDSVLFLSAVTAYEYADLFHRGRMAHAPPLENVIEDLSLLILDYPAEAWRIASRLPNYHGDPVDRMMLAHAIVAELTIVSVDEDVGRYGVPILW